MKIGKVIKEYEVVPEEEIPEMEPIELPKKEPELVPAGGGGDDNK